MAKANRRMDGFYQKNITIGRKADGSYLRKTIYGKTKKELELKIAEITQQVHQGIYVAEDKTSFGDMTEIWLTQYNPTANEKWIYRQECVINKHLLPALKFMKLKDLKTYHLQSIINQMAKGGLSTSTMKKAKQTAVRILNVGVENDLIVRNVFTNVKVPTVEPQERRALTEEEKELVNNTWHGHRMGCAAMIMMYCGLRRGELLALTWKDIDLDKKVLSVNKSVYVVKNQPQIKKPKSKAGIRDIPIPNVLADILCEIRHNCPLVCPDTQGKLMSDTAYRRAWNSYRHYLNLQAGGRDASRSRKKIQAVDNITAHMFRHTYASILYEAGVDIKSAQRFLGHADIEMTLAVYTHLTKFKEEQAVSSLNAHLDKYATSELQTTKIESPAPKNIKKRENLER
jgi:integrase